ncbi:hypothetical protein [Streptomyces sp. NBC_01387]|uniref:hypothetical protein n=1 Tax=Streptomyces sp. NBC_01387 TaxID=2903849 RepID=UPI0038692391
MARMSGTGRCLAVSGGDDGTVRIWDPERLSTYRVVPGRIRSIRALAPFTPGDRTLVAVAGQGSRIAVVDPAAGTVVRLLNSRVSAPTDPEGTRAGTGNQVVLSLREPASPLGATTGRRGVRARPAHLGERHPAVRIGGLGRRRTSLGREQRRLTGPARLRPAPRPADLRSPASSGRTALGARRRGCRGRCVAHGHPGPEARAAVAGAPHGAASGHPAPPGRQVGRGAGGGGLLRRPAARRRDAGGGHGARTGGRGPGHHRTGDVAHRVHRTGPDRCPVRALREVGTAGLRVASAHRSCADQGCLRARTVPGGGAVRERAGPVAGGGGRLPGECRGARGSRGRHRSLAGGRHLGTRGHAHATGGPAHAVGGVGSRRRHSRAVPRTGGPTGLPVCSPARPGTLGPERNTR